MLITSLFMVLVAYLLGSITSALPIAKLFNLPDPRTQGSNNAGATNIYRLGGKRPALLVLCADILKGTVPVYLGFYLGLTPLALGFVALGACLGHMYPVYFQFQGGKGVATALGCFLPLGFDFVGILITLWIIIYQIFRWSSLAALVTVGVAPSLAYWLQPDFTYPVAMLSGLIVFQHRSNILRLVQGNEPKT